MDQQHEREFLELYQEFRYTDQINYYQDRHTEFEHAQNQAILGSIILIFLASIAGIIASTTDAFWPRTISLILAALLPVLSTALAAYSTLYAFEQQAKLYQDTVNALRKAEAQLFPTARAGLTNEEFTEKMGTYVHEVENIFLVEQGQWGQLAKKMKPSEL